MQSETFVSQMNVVELYCQHHSTQRCEAKSLYSTDRELLRADQGDSTMSSISHREFEGPHSESLVLTAVRKFRDGVRAIARHIANRAAIQQLAEADEHMLHDIGLTRADVDAALRAPPLTDPISYARAFSGERQ
jgi:uncharacterized protein YjiS (DUF1127 family)